MRRPSERGDFFKIENLKQTYRSMEGNNEK